MKRLKAIAGDSSIAKLACCCVACCLGCIERCVRYLSRNAYVIMMVKGTGFCGSATEAFSLLTKHMVKVAVMRSVGWGFLLLGKVFIAGASAGTGALLLLTQRPWTTELFSIVPAVVAIAIGGWFIGSAFMGVYNMAIDTIFLCYTIDIERAKIGHELQQSTHGKAVGRLCDEAEAEYVAEERAAAAAAAARAERGGSFFGRRGGKSVAGGGGPVYPEVSARSGLDEAGASVVDGVPVASSTRGPVYVPEHHQPHGAVEMGERPRGRWDPWGGRV